MKCVMVYWSRYGNGKKLVDSLAVTLKKRGAETQVFTTGEANPAAMPNADVYVFSAPAEAFNLQANMRSFMKKLAGMDGKKYGIINTHGMKKSRLSKMENLLSKKNMVKIAEVDFQVGKDAQSGNGLMENWDTKLDDFAQKL
jgi:flavodoxin